VSRWLKDFLGCEFEFMYPLALRFCVVGGVTLPMRTFRVGSEATMTAMQISAVHHKSILR
jgi:hypothetical protein